MRVFFSKRVLSFPSPFAWYLCRSPTLSSTLEFGKAHSDIYIHTHTHIYIYIKPDSLRRQRGTVPSKGREKASTPTQQEAFSETTVFFTHFHCSKTNAKLLPFKLGILQQHYISNCQGKVVIVLQTAGKCPWSHSRCAITTTIKQK